MILDFSTLADAANVADGKINIHGGGVSRLNLPSFPFALPQIVVVARFVIEEGDLDRSFDVTISWVDESGELIAPMAEGSVAVGAPTTSIAPGEEQALFIVAGFNGLIFQERGMHEMRMTLDGHPVVSRRFPVVHVDEVLHPEG